MYALESVFKTLLIDGKLIMAVCWGVSFLEVQFSGQFVRLVVDYDLLDVGGSKDEVVGDVLTQSCGSQQGRVARSGCASASHMGRSRPSSR